MLAAAVTLSSLETAPATARQWKATPEAIAQDYATINDSRPSGELLVLMWFVPQMFPPNSPGAEAATTMLRKYVMVMAVHGSLDRPQVSSLSKTSTRCRPVIRTHVRLFLSRRAIYPR